MVRRLFRTLWKVRGVVEVFTPSFWLGVGDSCRDRWHSGWLETTGGGLVRVLSVEVLVSDLGLLVCFFSSAGTERTAG
ncbi:hypothetical protein GOBAR_AA31441 [Gossypium barbadense]|uniref:Uncharacterized protein n=1 Tax=Gossypium barbadense TaxID=3634 RepID=A0A2P5WDU0_GOSBA|nr:hypothetical protein GOBAR_AA31441 [Gossypium barbadense]